MSKSLQWPFLVWVLFGALWITRVYYQALPRAEAAAFDKNVDPEERVDCWLASTRCAVERHALLCLIGPGGRLYPIESCSAADDRGHSLLADVLAILRGHALDRRDLVRMNFFIGGFGVWVLAVMLWMKRLRVAALLCIFLAREYVIPGPIPGPDVPSAYTGIVSLALVALLWTSDEALAEEPRLRFLVGAFLSVFALGAAYLFRSPIAMPALLISEGFLLKHLLAFRRRLGTPFKRLLILMLLFATVPFWSPVLLKTRDRIYDLPRNPFAATHGFWPPLFLGLGTGPNPFGIHWDDWMGWDFAKQRDRSIYYSSPEYFRALRNGYLFIVFHHPVEVIKIYWRKTREVLALPFRWGGISIFWYLPALGLFIAYRGRQVFLREGLYPSAGIFVFLLLFLLQGVLGIPWAKHLYPAKWIVIIATGCALDSLVRSRRGFPEAR